MNLLIVDDSAKMRKMTRELVAMWFDEIFECSSGEEAIDAYKKYQPDYVFMDIKMKRANGITVTEEIMNHFPEAKIIIVTNYDDNNLREAAKKAGAREYFLKEEIFKLPEYLKLVNQF